MQALENFMMHEADEYNLYVQFLDPELRQAPILEPGRVAYLGESSNLPFLVDNGSNLAGVLHYQLPEYARDSRAKLAVMDKVEVKMLRQKGALSLPPGGVCDDLVESYFEWVAPVLPIIDRGRFMKQYRDPDNPPSLLLLQAIFLAASAVNSPGIIAVGKLFYKRAKALYDSGYENDRIVIIQALLLIGWYCERSRCNVEDVLYWNGLATTVALGAGMHRSAERATFTLADKRLWRRIWWTLFTRDRSTAILGQVVQIHSDDSDVEMVSEDDFVDLEYPPDVIHVQFFMHWVKLCILIDPLLSHRIGESPWIQFQNSGVAATRFELFLSTWLTTRPQTLRWEDSRYNFWSALLQRNYQASLSFLNSQHDSFSSMMET
ncbi:Transcriptional activator of fatty acid utilization [Aspergillus nanangensis]|uniref:Transcriptional activator of fatty acid utilization n=1 Tax=Aspergillus nanangensis TaxID=2582783 RepID=A0AAD4GTP1_ASPNN|nr:Transcriptional activator of fatty acid utilization [Aspergillus nanangensis]